MARITVLDQGTINKIAAGEVIERPSSVVKELVENAIDAKATSITIEIKEGGISFIRITDNGGGISRDQVRTAFLRHSTSKIKSVEDLLTVSSLGFRGEALSSIAAISQVELITRTADELTGTRYEVHGGVEKNFEEIGAPFGTTFIVRNIFYNTPARRKFLKTAATEGGYIGELIEKLALSRPDISFRFISSGQNKLYTSGNGQLKDVIYGVYGRDIVANLLPISCEGERFKMSGFIGKPVLNRGNRTQENYYINGRYIKSSIISKAIEDAYSGFGMPRKYPFTSIHFQIEQKDIDVNVHPTKMELRFSEGDKVYTEVYNAIYACLSHRDIIPQVSINEPGKSREIPAIPETKAPVQKPAGQKPIEQKPVELKIPEPFEIKRQQLVLNEEQAPYTSPSPSKAPEQMELLVDGKKLLSPENVESHRIIGQLFDTYWLIEFDGKLFIIDQHAAHEKVLYERYLKRANSGNVRTQQLMPPQLITLTLSAGQVLKDNMDIFNEMGFEIDLFGGNEYAVRGVPMELYGASGKDMINEIIDDLMSATGRVNKETIKDRIATMACKAAVKGNNRLSHEEVRELINELLTLENPYNCPHGRPTMISMSKYELEKKFKRIV